MHVKLQKLLRRIWTDANSILRDVGGRDTIEDRVYECYAASSPLGDQGIAIEQYYECLNQIDQLATQNEFSIQSGDEFVLYKELPTYKNSGRITRIYVNFKPAEVVTVCNGLFRLLTRPQGDHYRKIVE